MNEQYRTCPECGKQQTRDMFLPVSNSSLYGIDGTSYTCIHCIAKKIDRHDLGSIDKMCQFLDLPFDANKWLEMEKRYELFINFFTSLLFVKYKFLFTNIIFYINIWIYKNSLFIITSY